jgi:polyhydroxyalkanoate synthesis regulator protein
MTSAFGKTPMDMMTLDAPMKAIEEQTRRNMEMFQNAMRMFSPFGPQGAGGETGPGDEDAGAEKSGDDLSELREQIAAMQRKLDTMGKS